MGRCESRASSFRGLGGGSPSFPNTQLAFLLRWPALPVLPFWVRAPQGRPANFCLSLYREVIVTSLPKQEKNSEVRLTVGHRISSFLFQGFGLSLSVPAVSPSPLPFTDEFCLSLELSLKRISLTLLSP